MLAAAGKPSGDPRLLRPLRPRPLIHRKMGTAMRGQRPALASLLAWVAMLALLLGTLPLLPHPATAMTLQMPLEERGGEGPLQEEAPAKLRRCASAPVKAAEKAPAKVPAKVPAKASSEAPAKAAAKRPAAARKRAAS